MSDVLLNWFFNFFEKCVLRKMGGIQCDVNTFFEKRFRCFLISGATFFFLMKHQV